MKTLKLEPFKGICVSFDEESQEYVARTTEFRYITGVNENIVGAVYELCLAILAAREVRK